MQEKKKKMQKSMHLSINRYLIWSLIRRRLIIEKTENRKQTKRQFNYSRFSLKRRKEMKKRYIKRRRHCTTK